MVATHVTNGDAIFLFRFFRGMQITCTKSFIVTTYIYPIHQIFIQIIYFYNIHFFHPSNIYFERMLCHNGLIAHNQTFRLCSAYFNANEIIRNYHDNQEKMTGSKNKMCANCTLDGHL